MIGFDAFFRALHGHDPYPWQATLADRCATGEPPEVIAVPTGAGKTATVDALVWALACQADRPADERTVGVRIVWAIDRRILVDEVHRHASRLAQILAAARDDDADPLHPVASALARLARAGDQDDEATPLVATRWRGGIDDRRLLHSPLQPQLITSTVGQIGSRLLFRGYGVGAGSRALEAGLAAVDTTICLDEAHLAVPFSQCVERIGELRAANPANLRLPGLRAVTITATPDGETRPDQIVSLSAADRAHPELARRLDGRKTGRLVDGGDLNDRGRAALLARETLARLEGGAQTVACVVNTVRRAREVHKLIAAELGRWEEEVACEPLVGPQRPIDRSSFLDGAGRRLFDPGAEGPRVVCVATQTFEVGLDADVDALVTESASAAALVQRLGRLNRAGRPGVVGQATIVRCPRPWLYADDEEAAWEWLKELADECGEIDVSVAALDALRPFPRGDRDLPSAPFLSGETIELLAHTARDLGPWQEVDVEVFWRGADSDPDSDVSVCWRADLRPEARGTAADGYRELLLELVPPRREELLTLSDTAARALISATYPAGSAANARKLAVGDGDREGAAQPSAVPDYRETSHELPFVVLRGGELIHPDDPFPEDELLHGGLDAAYEQASERTRTRPWKLRTGDVLVLPARERPPVEHLPYDDCASDITGANVDGQSDDRPPAPVRLNPEAIGAALVQGGGAPLTQKRWEAIERLCETAQLRLLATRSRLERASILTGLLDALRETLPGHAGLARFAEVVLEEPAGQPQLREIAPADRRRVPLFEVEEEEADDAAEANGDGEDEAAAEQVERRDPAERGRPIERSWVLVFVVPARVDLTDRVGRDGERPPTLDAHLKAVEALSVAYADALSLAPPLRDALAAAAAGHDLGKADPRFQAFLRRGVRVVGEPLIAKSEFGTGDRATARIAAAVAGMPRRWHHEMLSVALVADAVATGRAPLRDGVDPDLVIHLIAAHHGRSRGLPAVPDGGSPGGTVQVALNGFEAKADGDRPGGQAHGEALRRFGRVNRRYGFWELAYLEAVLMLADRVVSARGL